MSVNFDQAHTRQFASNVEMLLQQKPSRLRGAVRVENYRGKSAQVVHQVGAQAAVRRTIRHADTPILDVPHDSRWLTPVDYEWGAFIDNQDKLRTIASFDSPYAETARAALNRGIDDEIIGAIFSDTTKTGIDGNTTTSWTTFVGANAAHQVPASAVGLTVAKLRAARKALSAAEVDLDMETLWCVVSAEEIDDLFTETQVVSIDYNTNRVLVDGKLQPFMGFNFIHSERLLTSGGNRRIPVFAQSGVALGLFDDVSIRIDERADKSYTTQVYGCITCGASRVEEKKVVEILCA